MFHGFSFICHCRPGLVGRVVAVAVIVVKHCLRWLSAILVSERSLTREGKHVTRAGFVGRVTGNM